MWFIFWDIIYLVNNDYKGILFFIRVVYLLIMNKYKFKNEFI